MKTTKKPMTIAYHGPTKTEKWKQELERTLEGLQAGTITFETACKRVREILLHSLSGARDGTVSRKEASAISRIVGNILRRGKSMLPI